MGVITDMRADRGWIKLWRKLADDPLWTSEPFTKGQAWVDLLLLAQGVNNTRNGEKSCEFKAGTVYLSILQLSKRWKWSRAKVRRFLDGLANDTMVSTTSDTTNGTTVTIENWAIYQSDGQQNGQRNERKTDSKTNIIKKNKEDKEDKRKKESASAASPLTGERVPAEGTGDDSIVIDGRLYRFPSRWRRDAEAMGKDLFLFVKGMYQ